MTKKVIRIIFGLKFFSICLEIPLENRISLPGSTIPHIFQTKLTPLVKVKVKKKKKMMMMMMMMKRT